jgi:uncharacterized membrane protein
MITPGSAALFVITDTGNTEVIMKKLQAENPKGKMIKTRLDKDVEKKLKESIKRK